MKTPEENLERLVKELAGSLGANLRSVVLYGSAARGDHAGANSDLNVLVEVIDGAPRGLEPAAAAQRRWRGAGNPALLFVTSEWVRNSADVFPIEFADMVAAHRVLHGEDPLSGISVSPEHLRQQCEHEVRSLVLKLRAAYLEAHGKASLLGDINVASFGSFTAVARAALRLVGEEVPLQNPVVLGLIARRFGLDPDALDAAAGIKQGRKVKDLEKMRAIYLAWFDQVSALGRALDSISVVAPGNSHQEH